MSEPTLTNKGNSLIQKGLQGETIEFTKFKIGNGDPGETDVKTLEDIVHPIKTIELDRIDRNDNNVILVGKGYTNSGIEEDVRWNEIGVYANDPDDGEILFAYINAEDEIEILKSEQCGISMENNLAVMLLISSEIDVTAVIASIQYTTKDEFLAHTSASNPHGTTKNDIGLGNVENLAISNQIPEFETGQNLSNFSAGSTVKTLVSKLWSVINEFITHKSASNPHPGSAAVGHSHEASDITSGILDESKGGTGYSSILSFLTQFGLKDLQVDSFYYFGYSHLYCSFKNKTYIQIGREEIPTTSANNSRSWTMHMANENFFAFDPFVLITVESATPGISTSYECDSGSVTIWLHNNTSSDVKKTVSYIIVGKQS